MDVSRKFFLSGLHVHASCPVFAQGTRGANHRLSTTVISQIGDSRANAPYCPSAQRHGARIVRAFRKPAAYTAIALAEVWHPSTTLWAFCLQFRQHVIGAALDRTSSVKPL